jgi:alpha-glucosidase (family GH31 glycosyl hydrolase)
MKLFKLSLFFLIAGCSILNAQNADRKYVSITQKNSIVEIKTNDGVYQIKPYSTKIFETSFIPNGEVYDPNSYAVVLEPENVEYSVVEKEDFIKLTTSGISVEIRKNPFQILYSYKGEPLISEGKGYVKTEEFEILDFNLTADEILFGGGARALGMNRRGNRLQLYNRAHYGYEETSELLNYTLPIVFSSNKYLLHFDNAPIGFLDLDSKKDNSLKYETISGRKTYQVVAGDSWEDLIDQYTSLTGKQPMIPRWALGNFSSRFGYHSQKEVEETIQKFKEDSIPVDAVILDLYWFGKEMKETMGNLEFERDSFPEPKKMISKLAKQGVKTILVTEPFILTTSKKWDEAVAQEVLATDKAGNPFTFDFYFGNTGLVDVFKPEAQTWFWNIYKDLAKMGVAGWWGDLGEPEVHPSELQHVTGTADEMHNVYGHSWAKLIFEGYQKDFPGQRPFILMRAGAAGSQRYGLIPWSGDVSRSWGGLKSQPEIALQMGMQGLAYMHSDLGGFAGDLQDDQLYVRWLQYGVFQPVYRPHAQEAVASEPVFKEPKTKALAKKAIELRYKLLPYNYTLAFENNQTGAPLMKPLFFEEPENMELYEVADTYLWGKDFLVSPVMQDSINKKEVYFPGNGNWFDFYSGKKHEGGTRDSISVSQDHIPTYVRGGAFIPMAKPMQTTANYSADILEVHYYFDQEIEESSSYLYHDDGKTPHSFENGQYEIIKFESNLSGDSLNLRIEKEDWENSTTAVRIVEIRVENLKKPLGFVWVNGIKYTNKNFLHRGKLNIPVRFDQNITTIKIEFN